MKQISHINQSQDSTNTSPKSCSSHQLTHEVGDDVGKILLDTTEKTGEGKSDSIQIEETPNNNTTDKIGFIEETIVQKTTFHDRCLQIASDFPLVSKFFGIIPLEFVAYGSVASMSATVMAAKVSYIASGLGIQRIIPSYVYMHGELYAGIFFSLSGIIFLYGVGNYLTNIMPYANHSMIQMEVSKKELHFHFQKDLKKFMNPEKGLDARGAMKTATEELLQFLSDIKNSDTPVFTQMRNNYSTLVLESWLLKGETMRNRIQKVTSNTHGFEVVDTTDESKRLSLLKSSLIAGVKFMSEIRGQYESRSENQGFLSPKSYISGCKALGKSVKESYNFFKTIKLTQVGTLEVRLKKKDI